jgi:hypothetical protein
VSVATPFEITGFRLPSFVTTSCIAIVSTSRTVAVPHPPSFDSISHAFRLLVSRFHRLSPSRHLSRRHVPFVASHPPSFARRVSHLLVPHFSPSSIASCCVPPRHVPFAAPRPLSIARCAVSVSPSRHTFRRLLLPLVSSYVSRAPPPLARPCCSMNVRPLSCFELKPGWQ